MNLGEKIETIILTRETGNYGEYLGCTGETFGACRIEGVVYKVTRPNEIGKPEFTILNVNTGEVAIVEDRFDLPMITEADFGDVK